MVRLLREFNNIYKAEIVVSAPAANGLAVTDLLKQDITNFLLVIPFVINSAFIEE
jgi:hypothetical protein